MILTRTHRVVYVFNTLPRRNESCTSEVKLHEKEPKRRIIIKYRARYKSQEKSLLETGGNTAATEYEESMTMVRLENILRPAPIPSLSASPVLAIMSPELFAGDGASITGKPLRLIQFAARLTLSPLGALLLLDAVLLRRGEVVLAVFHGALVGTQAGISGRKVLLQPLGQGVQGDDEGGQVEWYAGRAGVSLPDQECLG